MNIPIHKQPLLASIVSDLKKIQNIQAIVLGGSHASGQAHETSDLDLGIYYFKEKPFDLNEIKAVAKKYSTGNDDPTVTGFYEWGPWVNGGAWITNLISDVDFVYRSIEHVTSTIEKAQEGIWGNDFEQQPPYGFSSMIYLAETKACVPLYDPQSIIEKLKTAVQTYPFKLKNAVIQQSLWATDFTIMHAEGFSKKNDVYNTTGCLTRAVKYLVTTLFAINELYPMTDKKALDILESTNNHPTNLKDKVDNILTIKAGDLPYNVGLLKSLFSEIKDFAKELYKPYYSL